jgi:AraC-like DNA-binding protein
MMEKVEAKHYLYNYDDMLYCVYIEDMQNRVCEQMVDEHMLCYIISGEMVILKQGRQILKIHKGEAVLVKRNHLINKIKQPMGGEPFKGLFFKIKSSFLRQMRQKQNIILPTHVGGEIKADYIKIEPDAFLEAFFVSLEGYFDALRYPSKLMMDVKMQEAVTAMLEINPDLAAVLFDFEQPWRMDIKDFMNKNYTSDLSLVQFAHYTGRSLTSFKRDFTEAFGHITPARWIMTARLNQAKKMIENGSHPSDVYLRVGFKNLSHFSTAFHKKFGVAPSSLNS